MSTPVRSRQSFQAAVTSPLDPIDPSATTVENPSPAADHPAPGPSDQPSGTDTAGTTGSDPGRGRLPWRRDRKAPRPATPSGIQAEIAEGMTEAVVGLLAAGRLLAQLLLRRRGVEPWPMDYDDQVAIAAPVGRVGARHLPIELAPEIVLTVRDVAQCVGAISSWVSAAPRRRRAAAAVQVEGTAQ